MNALKIAKVAVQVITIGAAVATSIIASKELDTKIAQQVAKALENK